MANNYDPTPAYVAHVLREVFGKAFYLPAPAEPAGYSPTYSGIATRPERIAEHRAEFEAYSDKFEKTLFDEQSGGYLVTEKRRIKEAQINDNEKTKYRKELRMCTVISDNDYGVEYLHGVGRDVGATYDNHMISIAGEIIKADLKSITGGTGNIVKYASKALHEQGADAVVFEFHNHNPDIYEKISEIKRKYDIKVFFYFYDERILKYAK